MHLFVLAAAAMAVAAPAQQDATPLSCDGKPMAHHIHRARVVIAGAYSTERWADESPAKRSEVAAFQKHKACVLLPKERLGLQRYRHRMKHEFNAARTTAAYGDIDPPGAAWLAALRACESGGNYQTNTGNGYYGAYQFDLAAWASVGGVGNPAYASPAEQDYRAALLWRQRGGAPWPNCP